MSEFEYSADSFSKISAVLEARAAEFGANAFCLGKEIIEADVALDEAGPLTWALTIHADALARMGGISKPQSNMLPFTMKQDPDSPYGNLCVLQKGGIPMSMAYAFLDAALEHCVCTAMHAYDKTPQEWLDMPFHQRVVPIEPYFEDLQQNWVSDAMESTERSSWAINFPNLMTTKVLEQILLQERAQNEHPTEKQTVSRPVSFGSMK